MASIREHGLPSPVISVNSPAPSNTGSVLGNINLPTQRHHPLKPGSAKESALINYVDEKILMITRRYGTKFADIKTTTNEAPGYVSFDQVLADIDPLFDLVWSTGTPAIQISYFLTLAGLISSCMPAFDFHIGMFRSLRRFDAAFSTLLQSPRADADSRSAVSTTEKVRMKSIVEETRVNAINVASASGRSTRIEDLSDDDEDHMDVDVDTDLDDTDTAAALSNIYKLTLGILGDSLLS